MVSEGGGAQPDLVALVIALNRIARSTDSHLVLNDQRFAQLLADVCVKLDNAAPPVDPRSISNTAWALAKLSVQNLPLLAAISPAARLTMKDYSPQNISSLAWA